MSNSFSEYISSLEGQEDINPVEVARRLSELHDDEVSTRDAKISQLNNEIVARDSTISNRESEILRWKAKNLDLVMELPAAGIGEPPATQDDIRPDGASITIDHILKSVRK